MNKRIMVAGKPTLRRMAERNFIGTPRLIILLKTTFNIRILSGTVFDVKYAEVSRGLDLITQKKPPFKGGLFPLIFNSVLSPGKVRRALLEECRDAFFEISRLTRLDLAFVFESELLGEIV